MSDTKEKMWTPTHYLPVKVESNPFEHRTTNHGIIEQQFAYHQDEPNQLSRVTVSPEQLIPASELERSEPEFKEGDEVECSNLGSNWHSGRLPHEPFNVIMDQDDSIVSWGHIRKPQKSPRQQLIDHINELPEDELGDVMDKIKQ